MTHSILDEQAFDFSWAGIAFRLKLKYSALDDLIYRSWLNLLNSFIFSIEEVGFSDILLVIRKQISVNLAQLC